MKTLSLGITGLVLVASAAALPSMGGWAVVSVRQVPDAWIAGKPLELSWQVRQHGVTRLDGLRPTIEARSGTRRITGRTWAFEENGQRGYRGTLAFPAPGDWQVTIHSGFGRSRAVLVPLRVVDSEIPMRTTVEAHLRRRGVGALPEAERGRRAFAALGCVTCHTHRGVAIAGEVGDYGPELTDRRFAPDYLARFLADPSIKPPADGRRMPDLALRRQDIGPLVAFINAERRQARR